MDNLQYLHNKNLVHGDLSLKNIMLKHASYSRFQAAFINFGSCQEYMVEGEHCSENEEVKDFHAFGRDITFISRNAHYGSK